MNQTSAESRPGDGGPIFVVGSMRSGSTLLRLMLDSHENIAIGPETGFMGALSATQSIPNFKYGDVWFERLGWTRGELDERLRGFFGGMFERYAAGQGKPRWGDKTPFHTWHMTSMAQVFPDAVFVGIVRHPGAVATSLRDRFHYTFDEALSYWQATNTELLRQAHVLGDRLVICRYEDLVMRTEPLMRELLGWLGEPWSPSVLEHHRVHGERGSPRMSDGSTITRDSVDPDRASTWVDLLTEADQETLRDRAAQLAGCFGYSVDRAVSGENGWPVLEDGTRLARRLPPPGGSPAHAAVMEPDADPLELARRLALAEAALARIRRRRIVRLGDALRRVQRNRSVTDVHDALRVLRERPRRS